MDNSINISDYDYLLPQDRIAKFPLDERDGSKLLIYKDNGIRESIFRSLADEIPSGSLLAFNNTKVVRARLVFHKPTGARIEVFCLEPAQPADYEQAFAATGHSVWHCIVGNVKKWNSDLELSIAFPDGELRAHRLEGDLVGFSWTGELTFGQLLETLGRVPIPPYLCRESQELDNTRYQTTYARLEGSVAAPTAGLHFTPELLSQFDHAAVTLHVGAGTFLPVKVEDARQHAMHIEHFEIRRSELEKLVTNIGKIIAVGTTTVRSLESLAVLGDRVVRLGSPMAEEAVGQWEAYQGRVEGPLEELLKWMDSNKLDRLNCSTQIMITPGYEFRTINALITNFHQPRSTLLLLISALVGQQWHQIYDYALSHDFRFLSYGDSSLLWRGSH